MTHSDSSPTHRNFPTCINEVSSTRPARLVGAEPYRPRQYSRILATKTPWREKKALILGFKGDWPPGIARAPTPAGPIGGSQSCLPVDRGVVPTVSATDSAVEPSLRALDAEAPSGGEKLGGFVFVDADAPVDLDGRCRIFDFERSRRGYATLDIAYPLTPFPSRWCFADLPARSPTPRSTPTGPHSQRTASPCPPTGPPPTGQHSLDGSSLSAMPSNNRWNTIGTGARQQGALG